MSNGSITSWEWDFGDSESSSDQNPTHEYLTPNNFTVSITVTRTGGSNTEVKTDYILIPVGTIENASKITVVYPNPVTNNLRIIFPDARTRTISLKNMAGKNILELESNVKEEVLNMQSFAKGIYSLTIKTNSDNINTIMVIKK